MWKSYPFLPEAKEPAAGILSPELYNSQRSRWTPKQIQHSNSGSRGSFQWQRAGDGLCGGQIEAHRPGEADRRRSWRPEVPRLGSLAPPDHWDGKYCPGPERGPGAGSETFPSKAQVSLITGHSHFCTPPYTDNPSFRVTSRWQCAQLNAS